jgi:hypothetical protein
VREQQGQKMLIHKSDDHEFVGQFDTPKEFIVVWQSIQTKATK